MLAVQFTETGASLLDYGCASFESPIETTVFLDTKSPNIQGWSYGVRHDTRFLSLQSVTTQGTTAAQNFSNGFLVISFNDVFDCTNDPEPACPDGVLGGGYIAAIVLSLVQPASLPLGQSSLNLARYQVLALDEDARIEFSPRLRKKGSPLVSINFTVDGRSRQPRTLVDGWVRCSSPPFHRGDPSGDGRIDVTDAVHTFSFLYLLGPPPRCLEAADFDDNGRLDTADAIGILRWLFLLGSAPSSPGAPSQPCDRDPADSPAHLGCDAYEGC